MEARAALVEEEAARAAALEEGASAREELLRTLKEKASHWLTIIVICRFAEFSAIDLG